MFACCKLLMLYFQITYLILFQMCNIHSPAGRQSMSRVVCEHKECRVHAVPHTGAARWQSQALAHSQPTLMAAEGVLGQPYGCCQPIHVGNISFLLPFGGCCRLWSVGVLPSPAHTTSVTHLLHEQIQSNQWHCVLPAMHIGAEYVHALLFL